MRNSRSPEYSRPDRTFALATIEDDAIVEIRAEFEFARDFELKERLFNAFVIYELGKHESNRPRIEQKLRELRALSRSARELKEALAKLTFLESWWLEKEGNNIFSLHNLENELRWLHSIVSGHEEDEHGRKRIKRPYVKSLIQELEEIYREGTGRTDRVTYDAYADSDQYGGRFFDFVNCCFNIVGEKKSNSALGKAIQRAL